MLPAASLGTRLAPRQTTGVVPWLYPAGFSYAIAKNRGRCKPPSTSLHSYHRAKLLKPSLRYPADAPWRDSSLSNAAGRPRATTHTLTHVHLSSIHYCTCNTYNTYIHTAQGGSPESPATTTYVNLISISISCSYRQAHGVLRSPILIYLPVQNCPNRPSSSGGGCVRCCAGETSPFHWHHHTTHLEDPIKHRSSSAQNFHRLR